MRYLLDVNVWVALLDEAHIFHSQVLAFVEKPKIKIASCPLVENGVLRVLNLPSYGKYGPVGFVLVREKMQEICGFLNHEFWPDEISLRNPKIVDWSRVLGHNQITDIYLLALAVHHRGCLVTLDHRVTLSTVQGARETNLKLL